MAIGIIWKGGSGRRIIFKSASAGHITTDSTSDALQIEKEKIDKFILELSTLILIRG